MDENILFEQLLSQFFCPGKNNKTFSSDSLRSDELLCILLNGKAIKKRKLFNWCAAWGISCRYKEKFNSSLEIDKREQNDAAKDFNRVICLVQFSHRPQHRKSA